MAGSFRNLFRRQAGFILLILCVLPCGRSIARAEENQKTSPPKEKEKTVRFQSTVDIGVGSMDEDVFFLLLLEQGFSVKGLELQLSGPFRLRMVDNAPSDEGVLRGQDWDDPSDWARIVRTLSYEHSWENADLSTRFGELNGFSIGHGTVVSQYFNSTDMDYYQGGLAIKGNVSGTGLEYMMHNVVAPGVFAGRVFAAPFAWFRNSSAARYFEIGFTLMVDSGVAHRVFETGPTLVALAGGDASMRFLDYSRVKSTVYVDVAGMDGSGGVHTGLAGSFLLSEKREILLSLSGEYRYVGEDYYPALLNPFYDLNRSWFTTDPSTGERNTFAEHLFNDQMQNKAAHGFMVETTLDFNEKVMFMGRYDFQSNDRPHWVMFALAVSPVEQFSVRGFYAGQDIEGGSGLFSADSLIGLSYQHRVVGPLRLFLEFQRRFRGIADQFASSANEISGGAGVVFSY